MYFSQYVLRGVKIKKAEFARRTAGGRTRKLVPSLGERNRQVKYERASGGRGEASEQEKEVQSTCAKKNRLKRAGNEPLLCLHLN